jgi:hypothetical protein
MKIREVFEYEVEASTIDDVFTIKDYVHCVDDMTTPFWDGYIVPDSISHNLEIIEK